MGGEKYMRRGNGLTPLESPAACSGHIRLSWGLMPHESLTVRRVEVF